jgi:hypothetical protein
MHTAQARAFHLLLLVMVVVAVGSGQGASLPDRHEDTTTTTTHSGHNRDSTVQQHLARAPSGPVARAIAPLVCPAATETLTDGAELSLAAATANKTYVLGDGSYTINKTITYNTADTTTCFRGASRATVTILVATTLTSSNSGRAFRVSNGAKLGLFRLVLDGQDSAPGVRVGGTGSAMQADDVTLWRLRLNELPLDPNGAAVSAFNGAQLSITDSHLLDSTCPGGALLLFGIVAELTNVGRAHALSQLRTTCTCMFA